MTVEHIHTEELRRNHLFAGLEPEQLERVVQSARAIKLADGEPLFECQQPARHFFLVRSGHIRLFLRSQEGNEKIVHIVNAGETFGEAIMFMDSQIYPVNASAVGDSELIAFQSSVFRQLLSESVDTCFRLMADMSAWLKKQLNEIDALTLQNATLRFVNFILRDAPLSPQGIAHVKLPAPKNVIASRLSIQPESFSRILRNLQKAELISVEGNDITIKNVHGLRSLSSDGNVVASHDLHSE